MSIGTRIHGSIVSVLSGRPTYVIGTDSRVLELAEYHGIPHCTRDAFDTRKSIYDLYCSVDFSTVYRGHKERYENYVRFMQENGLPVQKPPFTDFYERFNAVKWNAPVAPITQVSPKEMVRRLNLYYKLLDARKREG